MSFLTPTLLVISSLLSLALIYYKIPTNIVNIILVLLIIFLIVSANRLNQSINPILKNLNTTFLISLCSLFVQIFVLSSGGFYSPFLILIHLYSLALSFLVNLPSSIIFLTTSSALLVFNSYYNPILLEKFKEDPFTLILYIVSFVVIIPLSHIVNRTYHLKSAIYEKLKNILVIQESKEASILRSLAEIVFITDPNLIILSANSAFENNLKLSEIDYKNKPALEVLKLLDSTNNPATKDSLYIDIVLKDRSTRIIEGFSLSTKTKPQPIYISIQLRPIVDSASKVTQLVFIVSEKAFTKIGQSLHQDLIPLKNSNLKLLSEIRNSLLRANIPSLDLQIELLAKSEEDLNIAQELEDHPIKEFKTLTDLALLSKKIVNQKIVFAKSLGVKLEFSLSANEVSEQAAINMTEQKSPFAGDVIPDFSIPLDSKWIEVMIQKLIELSILLSSDQKDQKILVEILKIGHIIKIKITSSSPQLGIDYNVLLKPYYDHLLFKSNLKLSSGLEGYIAKFISSQTESPITVEHNPNLKQTIFIITFTK